MEVIINEKELRPVVMAEVSRDRGMMGYSAGQNFQYSWKICTLNTSSHM